MIETWKKHGYIIIKFNDDQQIQLNEMFKFSKEFFVLTEEEKLECKNTLYRYIGYQIRNDLAKEFFQVRNTISELQTYMWPKNFPNFKNKCYDTWNLLFGIAANILNCIANHLSIPLDYIESILDNKPPEDQKYSSACLEVFHYIKSEGVVPCGHHTDIGLSTIIPTCIGNPALQLWDWHEGCWMDLETNAPKNSAVVFGGESLGRLLNYYIIPSPHRVAPTISERYSLPFIMLAHENAILDTKQANSTLIGQNNLESINARDFVSQVSSSRISSLFKMT